jgi:hypothetical protein
LLTEALVRAAAHDLPSDILGTILQQREAHLVTILADLWTTRDRSPSQIAWLLRFARVPTAWTIDTIADANPDADWSAVAAALPDEPLMATQVTLAACGMHRVAEVLRRELERRQAQPG